MSVIDRIKRKYEMPHEAPDLKQVSDMDLLEFGVQNIALEIHSSVLEKTLWFCSNEAMSEEVKKTHPDAVTYTAQELLNLLKLTLNEKDLKRIHEVKEVFKDSKVFDSMLSD